MKDKTVKLFAGEKTNIDCRGRQGCEKEKKDWNKMKKIRRLTGKKRKEM